MLLLGEQRNSFNALNSCFMFFFLNPKGKPAKQTLKHPPELKSLSLTDQVLYLMIMYFWKQSLELS